MEQFSTAFAKAVMAVCFGGLFLIAALAFATGLKSAFLRLRRAGVGRFIVLAPLVAVAVLYGGSKQREGRVSFPYTDPTNRYFTDDGSRVDDDGVWLAFRAVGVPNSADFHGVFRSIESTDDADWEEFLTGTVGQYLTPRLIPFENAKAFDFQFFSTYTAGPTVHTNGVLNVKWGVPTRASSGTVEALPIRSEVRLDSKPVATPYSSVLTNDFYKASTVEALTIEGGEGK